MFHDPGPRWLEDAARAARVLRATTRGARGAGQSVYVVLLEDLTRDEPWGLYVGQTSRDPDLRFDQHKAGYKASGATRRFGVRLLPELTAHLNPMRRWEALDLEAALAEAFRAAGIAWVEGGH
jgi:predicted GIY-YIG superfamily endonuclease